MKKTKNKSMFIYIKYLHIYIRFMFNSDVNSFDYSMYKHVFKFTFHSCNLFFPIFRWALPRFVEMTDCRSQPVLYSGHAKSHDYLQGSKPQNLYHSCKPRCNLNVKIQVWTCKKPKGRSCAAAASTILEKNLQFEVCRSAVSSLSYCKPKRRSPCFHHSVCLWP